uniref:Uncharacterized protein n=1 Tax=Arion vulgaris TaxID=1028688 RepID=A0A0B7A713_9EUPU
MSLELLDLEQIVKDYAEDFMGSDQKRHADLENPVIDWDKMHVLYGETKYTKPEIPPTPTSHVLFSANFMNNTPKPQTYALRTERRTKSSCSITFTKIFSYGGGIQMKLTPPNPVIEANAGFQANLTKETSITQTFEQELTWSVDNEISVPPGYQTKAELVIKEDSFNGEFQVLTTFEGKVVVTYETKKNKEHVSTVQVNLAKLLDRKKGFTIDEHKRPTFTVKGVCKCRFGVEQNVKLTESVIPPNSD